MSVPLRGQVQLAQHQDWRYRQVEARGAGGTGLKRQRWRTAWASSLVRDRQTRPCT